MYLRDNYSEGKLSDWKFWEVFFNSGNFRTR